MKLSLRMGVLLASAVLFNLTPPGVTPTQASDEFDALARMGPGQLDEMRGRNSLTNVQSIQDLDAMVSGGSFNVDTMTSGAITIEQNALESFEGVGIFNLFTGHNNAVDAAVGISVFLSE